MTEKIGEALGKNAFPGAVITLQGDLGAGKTCLARGIARGLGVTRISSPSYTIMNQYEGVLPIYHFDAYRVSDESEIEAIGGEEFFYGKGLTLIEWPEVIAPILPKERLAITIQYVDETTRKVGIEPLSAPYEKMIEGIGKALK